MKHILTFGQRIAREDVRRRLLRAAMLGLLSALLLWELTQ